MGKPRLNFSLFDKFGKFQMPSSEQVNSMDAETQERFRAIQDAAAVSEKATDTKKAAEKAVLDAIAERDAAEADLLRIRPRPTSVQVAKDWIASQRAEA
jgi:hypothetical protein